MPQPEYFGQTATPHDGLRVAYPDQPEFVFAGGNYNHTVQTTTNPHGHFTQHSQMGFMTPQALSIQYTTNQAQAPIPQNAHPVNPNHMAARRYHCQHPGCNKSVTRHCDLNRHMRTHRAGVKEFDCPDAGCNRKGVNGFPRKDKMLDHFNAVH